LTADVSGDVEKEDGVLVIKRIHVRYNLRADEEHRDTIDRVLRVHQDKCPVYRTVHQCIAITTEVKVKQ
jgi:uncharacterized OsmC-like protein